MAGAGAPEQLSSHTQDHAVTGTWQMESRLGAGNAGPVLPCGTEGIGVSLLLQRVWAGWEAPAESCEGKRKHFGLGRIPLALPHIAVSDKLQPPTLPSVSSRDGAVCGGWERLQLHKPPRP